MIFSILQEKQQDIFKFVITCLTDDVPNCLNTTLVIVTKQELMILMTYDYERPTNTTGNDKLLVVPIIEKLCKFWSIILAGT